MLHQNAFGPQFPTDFLADVASGNLPQVSWLVGSVLTSDHPPSPSIFGENILSLIMTALTANPAQWAKTLLLVTYDENGGFFDHVAPATPPPGTPGEFVTAPAFPDPSVIGTPAITGPIGLGFRVPMLMISPFTRGGFVSSDLFDHTSVLRFLETRFGAEVPNLSAWRRATVGDLTSALNFKKPDQSIPNLPSTLPAVQQAIQQCIANLAGYDTLHSAEHAERSDSGIRKRNSPQRCLLVRSKPAPIALVTRLYVHVTALRLRPRIASERQPSVQNPESRCLPGTAKIPICNMCQPLVFRYRTLRVTVTATERCETLIRFL